MKKMYKYFNWKNEINNEELNAIATILKNNGIVIFPTETVYGIGGNALSNEAVEKIYIAKNRPKQKALNIMVKSSDEISKYAEITSELEQKIIEKCMPGPLTIILKRKSSFGEHFTSGNSTIGIRIPKCKITMTILKSIDFPLTVPSANISNKPSGVNPTEIIKDFENTVDAIIDGGVIENGQVSTIVKVENNDIQILRAGALSKEDILKQINT